jgi:hypothetical protein
LLLPYADPWPGSTTMILTPRVVEQASFSSQVGVYVTLKIKEMTSGQQQPQQNDLFVGPVSETFPSSALDPNVRKKKN